MARATERTAPVAESPHARSTLKSSCPAGPTLVACQRCRRPVRSSARLYSPGGCGCALLMAPVMAAAMGLAALSLGMAALAVGGLAIAVALTVREVSRARGGQRSARVRGRRGRPVPGERPVPRVLHLALVRRLTVLERGSHALLAV